MNLHDNFVRWERLSVAPVSFKEVLIFNLSTLPNLYEEHQ